MTDTISCIACGSAGVRVFMEMERAPVFCNQLCHSQREALDAPVAPIKLGYCDACGHVFNVVFDHGLLEYSPEYENSLHFSAHFQQYADQLVRELRERYDLNGQTVVELGCGSGDFLRGLCAGTDTRGFGFDPSYQGQTDEREGVRVVRESYFDAEVAAPALFCCRHVLEHVEQPAEFVAAIAQKLGIDAAVPVYLEVPNVLYTLRDGGIWDIIYEHPSYFSPHSLSHVVAGAGFTRLEVQETFGGQFLSLHAVTGAGDAQPDAPVDVAARIDRFATDYRQKVGQWQADLEKWRSAGQRVVVWGAGSKGNSFLNVVPGAACITHIVDINPGKQGKFVAGMGQQIVPPEFLRDVSPDVVILMNAQYLEEVRSSLASLGLHPELRTA